MGHRSASHAHHAERGGDCSQLQELYDPWYFAFKLHTWRKLWEEALEINESSCETPRTYLSLWGEVGTEEYVKCQVPDTLPRETEKTVYRIVPYRRGEKSSKIQSLLEVHRTAESTANDRLPIVV